MAKKYKHIPSGVIVNEVIITGRSSGYGYRTEEGYDIPSWIVSGSDWEEVVERTWVTRERNDRKETTSVLRIIDDVVFNIGDKFKDKHSSLTHTIRGFLETENSRMLAISTSGSGCNLLEITKINDTLFTTHDGVAVTQPNLEVYSVCTKGGWDTSDKTSYQRNGGFAKNGTMFTENSVWKHFHSREARNEYLINNKPTQSFNDVRKACEGKDFVEVEWLISKLKANIRIDV